jgi:hypothetical protein
MAKVFQKIKMEAIFWLGRRLPTCKELTFWMSESLEQKLSLRRRILLNLHYMICVWCRRYNQQIHSLRTIAQSYADEEAKLPESSATSLTPEARERLKQALIRKEP